MICVYIYIDMVFSWPTAFCCRSASKDLREQLGPDLNFLGSVFPAPDIKFDMGWNELQKNKRIQKADVSQKIKTRLVFAYGPKTGPGFLRFFAFGVIRGGWAGVIYVLGLRPSRSAF